MSRVIHAERGKLLCHYCGVRPGTTTDHIVPRAFGGPDAIWNYVPSCATCNAEKGPSWPDHDCDKCNAAVARFLSDDKRKAKALARILAQTDEMTTGINALAERTRKLRRTRTKLHLLYAFIAGPKPVEDLVDFLVKKEN
jgi:hypothetical protein